MNSTLRESPREGNIRVNFKRGLKVEQGSRQPQRRAPQGKRLIIRGNSMLPQFKIAPEVLQALWATFRGQTQKRRAAGILTGRKNSPQHFLSIKITDLFWAGRSESSGSEDYQVRVLPGLAAVTATDLEGEYCKAQEAVNAVEARIEPLNLCRAVGAFDADPRSHKVDIKVHLVFPSISLQFTPVEALPSVHSIPLRPSFALGFLTQDYSGRVYCLSRKDAASSQRPLIGLWAHGVPVSSQSCDYPFLHPLVWAAAVQFLEMQKDKVMSTGKRPSFLFVYEGKSWYEVSVCGRATMGEEQYGWETATVVKRVRADAPVLLTFFPDDLVQDDSTCSSSAFSTPVRHISNLPSWDSKCSDFDPEAKIRLLEQQVRELQTQLKSATQSLCATPALSPKACRSERSRKVMDETGKWRNSVLNRSGVLFRVDEFEEVVGEVPVKPSPKPSNYAPSASPPTQKEKSLPSFFLFPCDLDTDSSYRIPTISYESDHSSDDESASVVALQQKYLI